LERKKTATIEDVAQLAGVSIATVSRALHHPQKVAEETRKRVHTAIAKTGFTANAMAQNLRRQRSRMILAIVPDIGNSFFSDILLGLEAVASKRGYGLLIGNTENDPEREAGFLEFIRSNKADGLVVLTGRLPANGEEIPRDLPPLLTVCERVPQSDVPFIGIDNVHAARLAVEHLIGLGHTNIAHVAGPMDNVLSRDRKEGWEQALRAAGVDLDQALVLGGDFSLESGRRAATQMITTDDPPTAFFCANDEMAIGVLQALNQQGLEVPGDCSVIGFDDIEFAGFTVPPLTTVRQPRRMIGERAMTAMIDLIERNQSPAEPVVLPVEVIVRESTCPVPRR